MHFPAGILFYAALALPTVLGGCATITDQSADQAFDEKRYDVALHEYAALSGKHDVHAAARLGYMYECGLGTRGMDVFDAEIWYRKAAEMGDMDSAAALGNLYQWYRPNYAEALQWDMQAARTGDGLAEANLAALYEYGLGVPRDYAAAQEWQQKADQQSWGNTMRFAATTSAAIAVHMRYDMQKAAPKAIGITLVGFDYTGSDQAENVTIEQSSGDKDLDAYALRAVATAILPPIPPVVLQAKLSHFHIYVDFARFNQPHGGFFWPTSW
jgi:hypothetical protein